MYPYVILTIKYCKLQMKIQVRAKGQELGQGPNAWVLMNPLSPTMGHRWMQFFVFWFYHVLVLFNYAMIIYDSKGKDAWDIYNDNAYEHRVIGNKMIIK